MTLLCRSINSRKRLVMVCMQSWARSGWYKYYLEWTMLAYCLISDKSPTSPSFHYHLFHEDASVHFTDNGWQGSPIPKILPNAVHFCLNSEGSTDTSFLLFFVLCIEYGGFSSRLQSSEVYPVLGHALWKRQLIKWDSAQNYRHAHQPIMTCSVLKLWRMWPLMLYS